MRLYIQRNNSQGRIVVRYRKEYAVTDRSTLRELPWNINLCVEARH